MGFVLRLDEIAMTVFHIEDTVGNGRDKAILSFAPAPRDDRKSQLGTQLQKP
jgi:hypothetical protein